ncbi:hypothetical protein OF385_09865 [Glutamicibacter sp. JL.03c]|uniref:hypothetical protein n=1 Tax=Glutamicibacter sp. JL.03c TaxID=2984842 RepID=UPI0021F7253A|nr:hypothetical protein [Glutamicibacter sp. JL.03c]UYQ76352.1 hypothetical protein OF385_09865 [Glutamicibacter sp. JL.03c]
MDTSQWISVQRDDGETVGYLEPLTVDYDIVQPRSILGHAVSGPCDYSEGEELIQDRGIGELMLPWILDGHAAGRAQELSIIELSAQGIVLGNALHAKALAPTDPIVLPWPDVDGRLKPAERPT